MHTQTTDGQHNLETELAQCAGSVKIYLDIVQKGERRSYTFNLLSKETDDLTI